MGGLAPASAARPLYVLAGLSGLLVGILVGSPSPVTVESAVSVLRVCAINTDVLTEAEIVVCCGERPCDQTNAKGCLLHLKTSYI